MTALIFALLVLGSALLVAEAHLPTYGALGLTGIGAIVAGMVIAVVESGGSVALALALALPLAVATVAVLVIAVRKALAVGRRRARCGADELVGHVGVVRRPLDPLGHISIDGELWRARPYAGGADLPVGTDVVVARVEGATLHVYASELP